MKFALLLTFTLLTWNHAFAEGKPSRSDSDLKIVVTKADNGKPVRNASVILHEVDEKGSQRSGGLQLKTDAEGSASYRGLPYGKLRIQVLARGLQTFGQDYEVDQPEQLIEIKLNTPQKQYSIYEEHPEQEKKE